MAVAAGEGGADDPEGVDVARPFVGATAPPILDAAQFATAADMVPELVPT